MKLRRLALACKQSVPLLLKIDKGPDVGLASVGDGRVDVKVLRFRARWIRKEIHRVEGQLGQNSRIANFAVSDLRQSAGKWCLSVDLLVVEEKLGPSCPLQETGCASPGLHGPLFIDDAK